MMDSQPAVPAFRGIAPRVDARFDFPVPLEDDGPSQGGLAFHQLRTSAQFAQVSHLRTEIQLPEGVRADPGFTAREKKETRPGLLVLSRCTAASLEPFGLFRWGWALLPAKA